LKTRIIVDFTTSFKFDCMISSFILSKSSVKLNWVIIYLSITLFLGKNIVTLGVDVWPSFTQLYGLNPYIKRIRTSPGLNSTYPKRNRTSTGLKATYPKRGRTSTGLNVTYPKRNRTSPELNDTFDKIFAHHSDRITHDAK